MSEKRTSVQLGIIAPLKQDSKSNTNVGKTVVMYPRVINYIHVLSGGLLAMEGSI